jgi:heme A synthase
MTNPYPSAADPSAAPAEVQTAYRLYIAGILIGVLGAILTFVNLPAAMDAAIAKQGDVPGLSAEQLRSATQIGAIVGGIVALVFVVLYILFIIKMRAGRNWARIVLTVLSALSVISTVFGIGTVFSEGGLGVVSGILTLVQLVLIVVAVYFMFRPASNAYFAAGSRRA